MLRAICVGLGWLIVGSASADWPRFLNSTFDGVASNVAEEIDWNAKPKYAWHVEVGDGYGLGVVADGRYYHFDSSTQRSLGGPIQERLRAFDLQTGKEIWSQLYRTEYRDLLGYEPGPRSSPTIDGDRIFTMGVTGILSARERADGKLRWSVDTNARYKVVQNFFGVGGSPLLFDGKVIVMVGGSPPEDQQIPPMQLDRVISDGSAVIAFDRDTGKEVWKCGDDLASYSSPRLIELDGKAYVLLLAREGLMLIDPRAGKVNWRFDFRAQKLESVNAMVPLVHDQQVFISECYQRGSVLLDVSPNQRSVVWRDPEDNPRQRSMRSHWATPVFVEGKLYGCSGRNPPDSDFRCMDWSSGKVEWSDDRGTRSSVSLAGNVLIILEERGLLQFARANPKKFDLISQWDLSEPDEDRPAIKYPCWAAPLVVGDKLLVRGNRKVVCLRLARGQND